MSIIFYVSRKPNFHPQRRGSGTTKQSIPTATTLLRASRDPNKVKLNVTCMYATYV